jgi:hypothetical protein
LTLKGVQRVLQLLEKESSSEMLVSADQSIWCYTPEDSHIHRMNSDCKWNKLCGILMKESKSYKEW